MPRPRNPRRRATTRPTKAGPIATAVIPNVAPSDLAPAELQHRLLDLVTCGAVLKPAGLAKKDPSRLLRGRYAATSLIELFDTSFYLTDYFQTPQLRFFVAYIVQPPASNGRVTIFPRIIYKDGSLIWRTASHMVSSDDDFWVGKGDVRTWRVGDEEHFESVESTTDLPFEMQSALEAVARRTVKVRNERAALDLVLRNAPASRVVAYSDFTEPRRKATADRRNLINGGRAIARFRNKKDPSSLQIVAGFEPDFAHGIVEKTSSTSVLYGGKLERFRILSVNRKIQYLFFAGPLQVWIIPPQTTTTELSSFGVRTVDVLVDDDMCVPGYEYHYLDQTEDPPVFYSQIPAGFAGP
ncbi:MAG: hypothetical protein HY899_19780, partial [Deltaproteobacteria bacterium]|nr:hypothetical protein [Deltaproteobacteria bacterium]